MLNKAVIEVSILAPTVSAILNITTKIINLLGFFLDSVLNLIGRGHPPFNVILTFAMSG